MGVDHPGFAVYDFDISCSAQTTVSNNVITSRAKCVVPSEHELVANIGTDSYEHYIRKVDDHVFLFGITNLDKQIDYPIVQITFGPVEGIDKDSLYQYFDYYGAEGMSCGSVPQMTVSFNNTVTTKKDGETYSYPGSVDIDSAGPCPTTLTDVTTSAIITYN